MDTVYLVADAWRKVKQDTVKNCFDVAFKGSPGFNILGDIPVPPGMEREGFEEEVSAVQDMEAEADAEEEDDDDDIAPEEEVQEDEETVEAPIKPAECLDALSKVRRYCQSNGIEIGGGELHSVLQHIENECLQTLFEGAKQTRITDFFSKGSN